jgi:hypothetical protein
MGKKCIPGVICIENMTLFVLILIFGTLIYMFYQAQAQAKIQTQAQPTAPMYLQPPIQTQVPMRMQLPLQTGLDTMSDPYMPPMRMEMRESYSQIGILTRDALILPLMGRQYQTGRDKWQYYTISNTGNLNTKLPVSVKGKSCTSEYGCDQIMNGDQIYVEGYNNTFNATVYENNMFRYMI